MSKPFYESKVFWFNILAGIIAVAGIFGFGEYKPSADVLEIIGVVVGGESQENYESERRLRGDEAKKDNLFLGFTPEFIKEIKSSQAAQLSSKSEDKAVNF